MNRILYIAVLLMLLISCGGGGGGSASIPEGYSKIQINIGSFKASANSAPSAATKASTTVPAGVTHLVFYDIRSIFPLNMSKITEFNVSQGLNEIFSTLMANGFHIVYVQALDSSGRILYVGARAITLSGGWYYIPIQMVPYSNQLPEFGGLESIDGITDNSMTLHWSAAADDTTPQDQIQYLIYMSLTPGGENFATPSFTSDPGQTSFTVTGLSPATTYYFVVRAMDLAANTDSNTVERSATTTGTTGRPPVFGGLISATAVSSNDVALTWEQATDDDTLPQNILYLIFMAAQPGGEDFANPWRVVRGVTSTFVRGLQPDTNYCFVARARDAGGATDSNTVEKCVRTPQLAPPPFTVAPTAGRICEDNSGCDKITLETLTMSISGGTPPYSMVSGNAGVIPSAPTITGNTYLVDATDNSIIADTVITLTFRDSQGITQDVTVTILNEIAVTPAAGGSICENDTLCTAGTETISYTASGGTAPYSVTTPGPVGITTTDNISFAFNAFDCNVLDSLGPTVTYTLFFQDANGTQQTAPLMVINQSDSACIASFVR